MHVCSFGALLFWFGNQNYHLDAESERPEDVTPDVDVYMIDMGEYYIPRLFLIFFFGRDGGHSLCERPGFPWVSSHIVMSAFDSHRQADRGARCLALVRSRSWRALVGLGK